MIAANVRATSLGDVVADRIEPATTGRRVYLSVGVACTEVDAQPPCRTNQADAALAALRGGMSVAEAARFHDVSRWTIARLRDANL